MPAAQDWYPPRYDRARRHTKEHVNERIDEMTRDKLAIVGADPHALRKRLDEIDREWHVDRALMGVFSVLGSISAWQAHKAIARGKPLSGWRLFFWVQMFFMGHHALRGWCPPLAVLRRIGFRTEKEIAAERVVLEKRLATSTGL